jgi:predicted MFS family arabinose efflux permease
MKIKEKPVLLLLAAAQFCNIVDFMIMMPLGHQMMRIFSISAQQFSFLVSSYTLSAGISGFVMVFFADKFDRKKLLTTMFFGFTLGTLACALSPTYEILLLSRIITGVFGGVIGSIVLAIVSDLVPVSRRGHAMGIINTAFSTASVVGVPLGLFLASLLSWHAPFLLIVAIAMPVLFLLHKKIPSLKSHIQSEKVKPLDVLKVIWQNSNQRSALLFVCVLMFAHFSIIPFLSPSMVANVGFTEQELTWIYFLGGGVSIITGPWIGRLADRLGKQKVFTIGATLALIPCFLITHLGPTPLPLALLVTTFFFIASGGRIIPAFAITSATVEPKNRGSFMSLQSSLQQISLGLASAIAGLIVVKDSQSGTLLNYPIVGYISIGAGILSLFLVRRIRIVETDVKGVAVEA